MVTIQTPSCSTRQSTSGFNFRLNCFLCGKPVSKKEKETKKAGSMACANCEVDIAMKKFISERGNEEWVISVNGRLQSVNELHAEDAIYHYVYNSNFRTGKSIPKLYSESGPSNSKKRGRPQEKTKDSAFLEVQQNLKDKEKEDEQVTLNDLVSMMESILPSPGDAYSSK